MLSFFNAKAHHDHQRRQTGEMPIDIACDMVSNGDLVLFSGSSQTSKTVTWLCGSPWSHVGIVYIPDQGEYKDVPLLFESIKSDDDGSTNFDVVTKQVRVGVRLVLLRSTFFEDNIRSALEKCVKEYRGLPYEMHNTNFIFARYDVIEIKQKGEPTTFFCSQLVAQCLKTAQLLQSEGSCIQWLPDDFSSDGKFEVSCPPWLATMGPVPVEISRTHYVDIASHWKLRRPSDHRGWFAAHASTAFTDIYGPPNTNRPYADDMAHV